MVSKPVARTLRLQLVGLAHVRMAGNFGRPKICRFTFVLSRPRKPICLCRREGSTAKWADVQSHLHTSSSPPRVPRAYLHIFCGCLLHACEPQMIAKSRQTVNALRSKRSFRPSLTYSICSRTNDTQLDSFSSGCHF